MGRFARPLSGRMGYGRPDRRHGCGTVGNFVMQIHFIGAGHSAPFHMDMALIIDDDERAGKPGPFGLG